MDFFLLRMNRIQAYSMTHFMVVLVIVAIALLAAVLLSKSPVSETAVVTCCGIVLAVFEVIKQILLTYVRGGVYAWSGLPFQLCSMPMYLSFVYILIRRSRDAIRCFIQIFGFIGAAAAFAIPYSSFYTYVILTVQSLAWHGILLFMSMYFLLKHKEETEIPYRKAAGLYLLLACIALIINISLYDISEGTCNMFFFGPGDSAVGILETIAARWGWVTSTICMVAAALLAGNIVYRVMNCLRKKLRQ